MIEQKPTKTTQPTRASITAPPNLKHWHKYLKFQLGCPSERMWFKLQLFSHSVISSTAPEGLSKVNTGIHTSIQILLYWGGFSAIAYWGWKLIGTALLYIQIIIPSFHVIAVTHLRHLLLYLLNQIQGKGKGHDNSRWLQKLFLREDNKHYQHMPNVELILL